MVRAAVASQGPLDHTYLCSCCTGLLTERIPAYRDEHGRIFIDRDPQLFAIILNFLRTREVRYVTPRRVSLTSVVHMSITQ